MLILLDLALIGDNDCLAAILAFDNFFFNCRAISSNSSFLRGVLTFWPFEPDAVGATADVLDMLKYSIVFFLLLSFLWKNYAHDVMKSNRAKFEDFWLYFMIREVDGISKQKCIVSVIWKLSNPKLENEIAGQNEVRKKIGKKNIIGDV